MVLKSSRVVWFFLVLAVTAVTLVGCALKPGSNDSSSNPPVVLPADTSTVTSNAPDLVLNTTAGKVTFNHSTHVNSYKKACTDCHTSNTPWAMMYHVGSHTMADMYAGKSCGTCHTGKAGNAFSLNYCSRCHSYDHTAAMAGTDPNQCVACHKAVYDEYKTVASSANPELDHASHGFAFYGDPTTGHAEDYSSGGGACAECHAHEAVTLGKSQAIAQAKALNIHDITCQTCHAETFASGKVRSNPNGSAGSIGLCATCHHIRYTYGDPSLGTADNGFPTKVAFSKTATSALPIEIMGWTNDGNAQYITSSTASIVASAAAAIESLITRKYIGRNSTTKKVVGGNYPHDSPQYDVVMGIDAGTLVTFKRDLDGNVLSFNDSGIKGYANACFECHLGDRDVPNGKFGHTFKTTEASIAKFYPGQSKTTLQHEIDTLLEELGKMLDPDGKDGVRWTRSGTENGIQLDGDLQTVMNNSALASSSKLLFLGAAWNYNTLHGDASEGIHNYAFVKSLLENTIAVLNQVKTKEGSDITWF